MLWRARMAMAAANRGADAGFSSGGRCVAAASRTFATTTTNSNSNTAKSDKLVIPVELVSDTMWPNGYIGKKHLRRAMDHVLKTSSHTSKKEVVFSVVRVPFLLEPHYPEDKAFVETNRARLEAKWGGPQGWSVQKSRHDLKGRGLDAGIPHFNLDRLTSNTLASHRLVQKIGKVYGLAVSERLYDALNVYYFVDGHSLNDHVALSKLTHQLLEENADQQTSKTDVMSEEEILLFLHSKEGSAEIEAALHALRTQLNIHSIPQFIIEGKTLIDGAAGSSKFIEVFNKIIKRGYVHSSTPIFADILGLTPEIVQQGSHMLPSDSEAA